MRKRKKLQEQIEKQVHAEVLAIRDNFKKQREARLADYASRGLGSSGPAFGESMKLYFDELEQIVRAHIDVEVRLHKDDSLTWSKNERERLNKKVTSVVDTGVNAITGQVTRGLARSGLSIDLSQQITRSGEKLEAHMLAYADIQVVAANNIIRRDNLIWWGKLVAGSLAALASLIGIILGIISLVSWLR